MSSTVLKRAVLKWLGYEGVAFFSMCLQEYGELTPVWAVGTGLTVIPHSVHFTEGMHLRNFLRTQPECKNWDSEQLDDRYVEVLQDALSLCDALEKEAEYRFD